MYLSKNKLIADKQLAVREVVVQYGDASILSSAGIVSTIEIGETVKEIVSVIHCDDSVPACTLIAAASRSISGTTIVVSSATLAANDSLIVRYKI